MCTVTFIAHNNSYYITSNRDEQLARKDAIAPQQYEYNGTTLLYPKDGAAGGSWIALHTNGNVAVLLNGGFIKHIPHPPYAASRGIILLEIISNAHPVNAFNTIPLKDIEPFTLILFGQNSLDECRWDGHKKYTVSLDNQEAHIWSSATLYEPAVIAKRKEWFGDWLLQTPNPTQQEILEFHRFAGDGDITNSLLMNRNNQLSTVSITSIALRNKLATMQYLDVKQNKTSIQQMHLLNTIMQKS
jgi:Transport and Golgi organisation 2